MSQGRLNVVKVMAAMAWSDGTLDDREKQELRRLGGKVGLSPAEQEQMEGYLSAPPSLAGVSFADLDEAERQAMYLLALHYAYQDRLVWSGERKTLDDLARMLDIAPPIRALLEGQVRAKSKG